MDLYTVNFTRNSNTQLSIRIINLMTPAMAIFLLKMLFLSYVLCYLSYLDMLGDMDCTEYLSSHHYRIRTCHVHRITVPFRSIHRL